MRFRAVIEMSFPYADPCDPTDYDKLILQCKQALENSPVFNCKSVSIREACTIGEEDDYADWRYHRGTYDASVPGIGRIEGAE